MTFDELEVGKAYLDQRNRVRLIVAKQGNEAVTRIDSPDFADAPFVVVDRNSSSVPIWRPYTPPPEPQVVYVYPVCGPNFLSWVSESSGDRAEQDAIRIGPVIKVDLPIDPEMLARVRGGAK